MKVIVDTNLNARLWTGDKKLLQGLEKVGFTKGITTDVLYTLIQNTGIDSE
jgi:hypothetical protein